MVTYVVIGFSLRVTLYPTFQNIAENRYQRLRAQQEETGNAIKIESFIPLSEMFGYVTDLRSFTQGRGTYIMQTDHYEEVPKNIAKEIIEKNSSKADK